MGAFITIALLFVALMLAPRLTTAAAFTLVSWMFVNEGVFLEGIPFLLQISVILTIALQLSPAMGGLVGTIRQKTFKLDRFLRYLIATFVTIVIGLIVLALLGLFLRFCIMPINELFGFFLVLVLNPILGFVTATMIQMSAEMFENFAEDKHKEDVEIARQKALEEERQRLAAEREAAQKRLDLACENMKALWEKALSTYGECERGAVGDFQRNLSTLPNSSIYKQLGVKAPWVPGYYVFWQGEDPNPVQIWVTNENRIQAIEEILRGVEMLQYGQGCICRPIGSSPQPIRISGQDDSRPWLQLIECVYTKFCQDIDDEYCDTLAQITKYYNGEYMAIKAGLDGEEYIRRALELHDGEFFVLYDLRLEFPGSDGGNDSVETDVLVLAPNGIFAIEVKNYGSTGKYKIIVTADGQWYKELPGGKRESIPNPVAQNDRHIAFLGRFINELLGRDMMHRAAIENVIAIANDAVETDIYPGAPLTVTRAGNIYNCIMADRSPKFKLDELHLIKQELEKRALPPKAYPLYDYSERIKWVNQKRKVLRHGAYVLNKAAQEHPDWFAAL